MNTLDLRAQDIFCELAAIAPDQRTERLAALCGDDAALQAQVLSLLRHHDSVEGQQEFLDGDHLRDLLDTPIGAKLSEGARVGQYTVTSYIGGGGMGDVYAARQERPSRMVALKIIRPGLATPRLLRLFERETEVLGRLSHPGVAQVFEAGVADYGYGPQPFLAMELIDGPPLTELLKLHQLPLAQRLELFAQICDAVQHAHQRGVIHRDLKPGNILVECITNPDGLLTFRPKVLDFGVARTVATAGRGTHATTVFTSPGLMMGTLPYMSPEQVSGDTTDVDIRSDVYSLGVVLFRMLSGRLPHELTNIPSHEAVRKICEEVPQKLGALDRAFRGDLETIVARAIEKDRARRYQSAADLADDVRRFIGGQPITARQDSALYVLSRQLRRYRTTLAIGAAALIFTVGAMAFAVVKAKQEARANQSTQLALAEAKLQREAADRGAAELSVQLRQANIRRARLLAASGSFVVSEQVLRDARAGEESTDEEGTWATREVVNQARVLLSAKIPVGAMSVVAIDDQTCAVAFEDGQIQVRSLDDFRLLRTIDAHVKRIVRIRPLPGGRLISIGDDGFTRLWNAMDGTLIAEDKVTPTRPSALAVIDETNAVIGDVSGNVVQIEIPSLYVSRALGKTVPATQCLAVSTTLDLIAAGSENGHASLWKYSTGEFVKDIPVHGSSMRGIALIEATHTLMTAGVDRNVVHIDLNNFERISIENMDNGSLGGITLSPDGSRAAVAGWWCCRIMDTASRKNLPFSPSEPTREACFTPDGEHLLSVSGRERLRLWSLSPVGEEIIARHAGRANCVATSPDGRWVASVGGDAKLIVTDLTGGAEQRTVTLTSQGLNIVFMGSTPVVAVALDSNELVTVNIEDGTVKSISKLGSRTNGLAATADGAFLFSGGRDGVLRKWEVASGTLVKQTDRSGGEILGVDLSKDQTMLGVTARTRHLGLFDPNDLSLRKELASESTFWAGRFSPDSRRFIGGTWMPDVRQYDVQTGELIVTHRGHSQLIPLAIPSVDGKFVYSAGMEGVVKVWSAETGDEFASFSGGSNAFWIAALPDGFVVPFNDGTVRRWSTREMDARARHTFFEEPR